MHVQSKITQLCYTKVSIQFQGRSLNLNYYSLKLVACFSLGRFPFIRTDQPDHPSQNKNFTFNQNYPVRSVRSQLAYTKEMVFQQNSWNFIVKMTGPAMVRPASSDFWKAPLV